MYTSREELSLLTSIIVLLFTIIFCFVDVLKPNDEKLLALSDCYPNIKSMTI